MEENEIVIIDEKTLESKIYIIRGQKVMLDFELAEIYGYETKRFNEQVKNNIAKFPDDFRFRLTKEEVVSLSRSKISTAMPIMQTEGLHGGRTSLPYAFTEQGIYMLISVLKGELATKQSLAIVRLFKQMKDYIIETSGHLLTTNTNSYIESKFSSIDARFEVVESKLDVVMDNFIDPSTYKHFLILDGERIESDIAYQQIYSLAKKSIIIIDDYISIKTLELLKICDKSISITICSDNVARNNITEEQLEDFKNDTGLLVEIKPTNNRVHDRYIVIDYQTDNEILYHSGASSKDSGNRITTIMRIEDSGGYHHLIDELNPNC